MLIPEPFFSVLLILIEYTWAKLTGREFRPEGRDKC